MLAAFIAFMLCSTTPVWAQQQDQSIKEKVNVKMKDGKMMVKNGLKWDDMDKEIRMKDGTVIMTNGTVKMKDGTTKTMKEGEEMNFGHKMKKTTKKAKEEKVIKDEKPLK